MSLVIVAYNISVGGGKVLLGQLIKSLEDQKEVEIWLDTRNTIDIPSIWIKHYVKPDILSRLKAESKIAFSSGGKVHLFFGNLPPLFPLRKGAKVYQYLQNRYLLLATSIKSSSNVNWLSLRSFIERWWFRLRYRPQFTCLVQTQDMKSAFLRIFPNGRCEILPFLDPIENGGYVGHSDKNFIYVASPDPHKNHMQLIEAMKLLAVEGIKPELKLIFDKEKNLKLCRVIDECNSNFETRIRAVGPLSHQSVLEEYKTSRCLIFPSSIESLGLPLIEATWLGLDVLAPELDYVRELIDPLETFDPNSSVSIKRAIKRYLRMPEKKIRILSSYEFSRRILK